MNYKDKIMTYIQKAKVLIYQRKYLFGAIGAVVAIIAFTIILGLILGLTQKSFNKISAPKTAEQPILYSSLLFAPSQLIITDQKIENVSIVVDAGINKLSDVAFTVKFDPNAFESFDIIQQLDNKSALSNSLDKKASLVAFSQGYANFSLSLKPKALEQEGSGTIAKIFFVVKPTFLGTTTISFSNINLVSKSMALKGKYSPQTNTLTVLRSK